MKKNPNKKLKDCTKEELIRFVKNLDAQLTNAIKMVSALRYVLKYEFRVPQQYWENYIDMIEEEEFEEPCPPGYKEPSPEKSKKKDKGMEAYQ